MAKEGFGSVPRGRRVPSPRPGAVGRVRELRAQSTEAEDLLWERLRGRRVLGLKFRRQLPIEGFITDFCCYDQKLVVELDGEVHSDPAQAARDANRDAYLLSLGYKVLRFSNQRIHDSMPDVLKEIGQATSVAHLLEA